MSSKERLASLLATVTPEGTVTAPPTLEVPGADMARFTSLVVPPAATATPVLTA